MECFFKKLLLNFWTLTFSKLSLFLPVQWGLLRVVFSKSVIHSPLPFLSFVLASLYCDIDRAKKNTFLATLSLGKPILVKKVFSEEGNSAGSRPSKKRKKAFLTPIWKVLQVLPQSQEMGKLSLFQLRGLQFFLWFQVPAQFGAYRSIGRSSSEGKWTSIPKIGISSRTLCTSLSDPSTLTWH